MKKIIVFGATGGTGIQVVKQSLEKGYAVTVILRTPATFQLQHQNLRIIKGDVLQPISFQNEMIGQTAVISCLGVGSNTKPTVVYSNGIENILSAMHKENVTRLICISAGALYTNRQMGFFIKGITKFVLQNIFKNLYADMRLMENKLENSNTNWTIIRPPMLKNSSLKKIQNCRSISY